MTSSLTEWPGFMKDSFSKMRPSGNTCTLDKKAIWAIFKICSVKKILGVLTYLECSSENVQQGTIILPTTY